MRDLLYCFDAADLQIEKNGPFAIQAEYAKQSGVLLIIDSKTGKIFPETDLLEKNVFLRCSCSQYKANIDLLNSLGAVILESEKDIHSVENWFSKNFSKRTIKKVSMEDFENPSRLPVDRCESSRFFVKSVVKDFSAIVSSDILFSRDKDWIDFIRGRAEGSGDSFLISDYVPILSDSIGKVEYRHIVINGSVINSSRCIHSLHHKVPTRQKEYSETMAKTIKSDPSFPDNYVLDTAVFLDRSGCPFYDVVEINPVTTSLCYINNSIFFKPSEIIASVTQNVSFGYEYCLDYLNHPQQYDMIRKPDKNYCYYSDNSVTFL